LLIFNFFSLPSSQPLFPVFYAEYIHIHACTCQRVPTNVHVHVYMCVRNICVCGLHMAHLHHVSFIIDSGKSIALAYILVRVKHSHVHGW
jgi:hypothetical protein